MFLARVRIRNFRYFADQIVHLRPGLNVLLRENNAGKTPVIKALGLVLDQKGPVAIDLRLSLIEVAAARQTNARQSTKIGTLYDDLTGPRFRAHVDSIVEKFTAMEQDLAKERKTMTRLWAKREEQICGVIESTPGM